MSTGSPSSSDSQTTMQPSESERFVYVLPHEAYSSDDEVSLFELWNILWDGKWIGFAITLICATTTAIVSLNMTEWYRAEVLLAPAEERRSGDVRSALGNLGGLAGLAGISVGGGGNVEAIAILRSRGFIREFIEDLDLMPVLFADQWDVAAGEWKSADPDERPDVREAVKFFHDSVLTVSEDIQTGLVTLAIEWTDPAVAADWASTLVDRLNDRMRAQALWDAETNVAYLQETLASTSLVAMQQSIGRLLETEMQKLMLARGNEQFSFKVLDPAQEPRQRSRPKRTLMVILAILFGGVVSVFAIFVRHGLRRRSKASSQSDAPKSPSP